MNNEITIDSGKKLWLASDLHFGHRKLTKGCEFHFDKTRNYQTTDEMNADVIRIWNETVSKDDVVIFLGDFIMCCPNSRLVEAFYSLSSQLNGQLYYIIGNHDYELSKRVTSEVFHPYLLVHWNGKDILCQHRDLNEEKRFFDEFYKDGMYFVHGHIHFPDQIVTTFGNVKQNNVCWDGISGLFDANNLVR